MYQEIKCIYYTTINDKGIVRTLEAQKDFESYIYSTYDEQVDYNKGKFILEINYQTDSKTAQLVITYKRDIK